MLEHDDSPFSLGTPLQTYIIVPLYVLQDPSFELVRVSSQFVLIFLNNFVTMRLVLFLLKIETNK